ncbi:DNA repair protein XRCC4-like isoform X1 [Lethenteron reissneri]|uniref:DNA repair protein XRCC4-like isoform X1 n=1 Tax=Lethenteron reissneri TaxID=7753 RepID=UPI002AB64157|nr:DNA repair protein XRCC4-like isoform X1 [Lethenteron reissneri]XP_061414462.1 DNA repair protein XRCC4-like isoform X1 [Lethenteron reissneri]
MGEEGEVIRLHLSSDPGSTYYALVTWKKNSHQGLNLSLTDCRTAWTGEVTSSKLEEEASEAGLSLVDYVAELRAALLGHCWDSSSNGDLFRYDLKPPASPGRARRRCFSICKVHSDVTFELGTVELRELDEPVTLVRRLLDRGLEGERRLRQRNDDLQRDNERLAEERGRAIQELRASVDNKDELERDLYGKFIHVLNEKKEKIRRLKDTLDKHAAAQVPPPCASAGGVVGGSSAARAAEGTDESDYGGTTDEESQAPATGTGNRKAAKAPSTVSVTQQEGERRGAVTAFDPYDDDDDDGARVGGMDAGAGPTRRQRKRRGHQQVTVTETPAAAVLPPPAKTKPANESRPTRRGAAQPEPTTASRQSLRKAARGGGGSGNSDDTLELLYDF